MVNFTYINSKEALDNAAEEWSKVKELGIDLECENNLHHYGAYISLIQISSGERNWIVDVLNLSDLEPLLRIMKDNSIQKIFHDVGFDLRILNHQFKCIPKNIFDTQIAALFLGKEDIGLGALLEEYFNIKKERKFQMADWTKRPLSGDMLTYACKDTIYLIQLRDKLINELKQKGRLSWIDEELKLLENNDFEYKEGTYSDLKGTKTYSGRERAILKRLYSLREQLAKKVDKPVHFVMSTKIMLNLVQNPPRSVQQWRNLRGVHPIVRNRANKFCAAVSRGRHEQINLPRRVIKRHSQEEKDRMKEITEARDKLAEKLGIRGHLILNKDQIRDIAVTGKRNSLHRWQRELLKDLV